MATWLNTDNLVTLVMIITQLNLGAVILTCKYLAARGYSLRVLFAYRMILATIFYPPAIYIHERSTPDYQTPRHHLTWKVFGLAFLCSFLGVAVSYNLTAFGLELAAASTNASISNLFPAITFVIAVILRRESLDISTLAGRAKVMGTLIAISGAMIISFYEGTNINIVPHYFRLRYPEFFALVSAQRLMSNVQKHHEFLGVLATFSGNIFSVASMIIEDKLLQKYPEPVKATGIIVALGAVQCATFAGFTEKEASKWRLESKAHWVAIIYMAFFASGIMMVLTLWCIAKKGAFFISRFSPITLIMVVLISPFILQESLNIGSVIGAIIILIGICLVLWGKKHDADISDRGNSDE